MLRRWCLTIRQERLLHLKNTYMYLYIYDPPKYSNGIRIHNFSNSRRFFIPLDQTLGVKHKI